MAGVASTAGHRFISNGSWLGAVMVIAGLRYSSTRAEKARIGMSLTQQWLNVLAILTIALAVTGALFVGLGSAIGWALIGFAAVPAMIIEWRKGELEDLVPSQKVEAVDDILAYDVLGLLPRVASPHDIATVVGRLYGGHFFAARFGIGVGFLQEVSSKDSNDTAAVWDEAYRLKEQLQTDTITAALLVGALIKVHPKHAALLAHLQLDIDDIIAGIEWQNHLHTIVTAYKKPQRTGGIARDWSFGWIPLLSRFGQNISQARSTALIELEAHKDALDQLVTTLGADGRHNVVLVGPTGVGKTEVVNAFAELLLDAQSDIPKELRFRQVFQLDASSLIASAPGRGELESLVTQLLSEAYDAKNVIVCLDNAQVFFEEAIGSVDLSNVLLPVLEAGRIRLILTMDEQRYLQISRRNPQLTNSLNRISVLPATKDETMRVMQDRLLGFESIHGVTYMYQALSEVYRLSERYMHELAMPGRALGLLESAANYAEDGLVTVNSVQQAIEKSIHVKVANANSNDERDKLLHMEDLIHERMINQTRAVAVVSDALRRARAGVRNQNRPIGTFLFLGPTGVGKTELAKALADVYFEGEDHMIRLDMNEYVKSSDVARLIADGADDAGSLTAQVMKQPFSVILLDEIEKAHPNVLTTFLQVLDEGILRDERNREVSFRDAIIIATSNAGADRIREHIERGMDIEQFEDQFVDELIESDQFRPEFLNRFDEIVMFRPLTKGELTQVVDLILKGVNATLSLQQITVHVSEETKQYLVEAGYDPRLGARPMRRVVQKAVENTVAKKVLAGEVEPGDEVEVSLEEVQQILGNRKKAEEIVSENIT